jgi:hypothetical protein
MPRCLTQGKEFAALFIELEIFRKQADSAINKLTG